MTTPLLVPNPRLDTFVERAPDGARQRLTVYSGIIQFGARPSLLGAAAWGTLTAFRHEWLLPDSLPYRADRLGGAQVSCTIAPQSMHENFDLNALVAGLHPDPDGAHAWVRFDFAVTTRVGTLGSYRVEVLVPPDAVREPGT